MPQQSLSFGDHAVAYAGAFVAIAVLDGLWLGVIARDLYKAEIGALMKDSIPLAPAALFYIAYPLALSVLMLMTRPDTLVAAALAAALVGLTAYGVYDVTNLATLKGWSVKISIIDALWGTFASACAGGAAWLALQWKLR
jgi:uncharacterized membrane protein